MAFIRVLRAQMTRWVKTEFFRPMTLFWNIILPLSWGLQFYFLYIPFRFGKIDLEFVNVSSVGVELLGFTLTGQVCWMLFINTSLFGGAFFLRERWEGTLEVLFLSPASRIGIIIGTSLAGATNFLWFTFGLGIAVLLLNIELHISSWFAVLVSLSISFIVLLSLGMFFEAFFIASRLGGMWATAIQEPLQFVSGLIFPIQYLPSILRAFAAAIPFTYVLLIVRGTLLGALTLAEIQWELTILVFMALVLVGLSIFFMERVEHHVKRQGNLRLF
ncbi:MAG: ABC transporter permease [Candidatus Hodarchaeota archaeon]